MQRYKSIFSRDIGDQRTLQSDWVTAFWPISSVPEFSRHRVCTGRKNNKIFCNRVLSARHNEKNFTKTLKKTYFCPIFVQFCPQNKTFREKFGSATFERLWFSNVMHNISKNQWVDSKKSMSGADQWAHK